MMEWDEDNLAELSAGIDGELDEAGAKRIEKAATEDPRLARTLAELRAVRKLVASLPREPAPEGFADRVLARARRRPVATGGGWLRHVATAAVLLVAASIGVIVVAALWHARPSDTLPVASGPGGSDRPGGVEIARGRDFAEDAARWREGDRLSKKALSPAPDRGRTNVKPAPAGRATGTGGTALAKGKDGGDADGGSRTYGKGAPGGQDGATLGVAVGDGRRGELAPDQLQVAGADVRNVDIYTADLPAARKQLEEVLARNGIQRLDTILAEPLAVQAKRMSRAGHMTFYQTNRDTRAQVQVLAFVPPEKLEKLESDLAALGEQQTVARRERLRTVGGKAEGTDPSAVPRPSPGEPGPSRAPTTAPCPVAVSPAEDEGRKRPPAPLTRAGEAPAGLGTERPEPVGGAGVARSATRPAAEAQSLPVASGHVAQAAAKQIGKIGARRIGANVQPLLITLSFRLASATSAPAALLDQGGKPRGATPARGE